MPFGRDVQSEIALLGYGLPFARERNFIARNTIAIVPIPLSYPLPIAC